METINAKHSGLLGDLIYSLPAIKTASEKYGKKIAFYIWMNKAWESYGNYHDATKKGEGLMSEQSYNMIKPLLESLPYIDKVDKWTGQQIHIDLDKPKVMGRQIGLPYANMSRQYFYAYPDLACDLSLPTIDMSKHVSDIPVFTGVGKPKMTNESILVNRTSRWLNPHISYMFLQQYKDVWFVGTIDEYSDFCLQVPHAHYYKVKDFHSMAWLIAKAKVFIGNQSLAYAIAEQMKVPRILEVCPEAPNVMPIGPNGYDFFTQESLEFYVSELTK